MYSLWILTLPILPCLGGPELCKQAVLTKTSINIFHGTLTADYFYNLGCSASDSFSFTMWSVILSLTTDGNPTWCLLLTALQHVLSSALQPVRSIQLKCFLFQSTVLLFLSLIPPLHSPLIYLSSIFMLCRFFASIAQILFKWIQQAVVSMGLPLFPLLTPFLHEQQTALLLPLLESEKQFHSEDLLLFLSSLLDSDAWGGYCKKCWPPPSPHWHSHYFWLCHSL